MLWLIFFILIVLWLLGIAAVIILIINLATGRPVE
jgi:hypothetical protein